MESSPRKIDHIVGIALIKEPIRLEISLHDFTLPQEKWPAPKVVDGTPAPLHVHPIDPRIAIRTRRIWTIQSGEANHRRQRITQVPRVVPSREVHQILRLADITLAKRSSCNRMFFVELLTRKETCHRFAIRVLHADMQLGKPGGWH